jgi:hypothetical protein
VAVITGAKDGWADADVVIASYEMMARLADDTKDQGFNVVSAVRRPEWSLRKIFENPFACIDALQTLLKGCSVRSSINSTKLLRKVGAHAYVMSCYFLSGRVAHAQERKGQAQRRDSANPNGTRVHYK